MRNRKKRSCGKKRKQDEREECEKLTEENKMKGRRKAICEVSAADREALVLELEKYVRFHRLTEYGIIANQDATERRYLQQINGPLLKTGAQTNRV